MERKPNTNRQMQTVKNSFLFLLLFMTALLFLPKVHEVNAASASLKDLKFDQTYTNYDVTGDGKKDTFKATFDLDEQVSHDSIFIGKTMRLYLNNACVNVINPNCMFSKDRTTLQLVTLKNGKVYLHITARADIPSVSGLYQYKSGKFVIAANFHTFYGSYGYNQYASITKVSGNTITVKSNNATYTVGAVQSKFVYTYKNGALKCGTTGTIVGTPLTYLKKTYYTASRSIPLYKTAGGTKKIATIKKGNQVTVKKCWVKGGKYYFQVTVKNGATGWIKAIKKTAYFSKGMLFEEAGLSE